MMHSDVQNEGQIIGRQYIDRQAQTHAVTEEYNMHIVYLPVDFNIAQNINLQILF